MQDPQYNPNLNFDTDNGLGNGIFQNDTGNTQSYHPDSPFDLEADSELKKLMQGIDVSNSSQGTEKKQMSPLETKPVDFSKAYDD
jgi:hypothetical protein